MNLFLIYSVIPEKFGIVKSTVSDLKKNKEKNCSFQRKNDSFHALVPNTAPLQYKESIQLYRYDGHISHCPQ